MKFFSLLIFACLISCSSTSSSEADYPDITTFNTNRTNQFIIDMKDVEDGHMFRGGNADAPHQGAHVNFVNNGDGTVYSEGAAATTYPPIYAIADGTITAIEPYYAVTNDSGTHYRYGISLAFASMGENTISMEYSIEPMVDPGNSNFYTEFITVSVGDTVKKGDIIAYMYISTDNSIGTDHHIHFALKSNNQFYAPAIFSSDIMTNFHSKISDDDDKHNHAGGPDTGEDMGNCMGYKISDTENPFSENAQDCLK